MLKRTKSYLLLTFLVLTGFAGRIENECLSGKERNVLVSELKQGKKALLNSIKDLDEAQLQFKTSEGAWSIKETVYHLSITENNLWKWAESAVKPNTEQEMAGNTIPDQVFMNLARERMHKLETNEALLPVNSGFKNMDDAVEAFRSGRTNLVKFVKTTTENIRKCGVETHLGKIDAYQLLVLISEHTNQHIAEIEVIKNNPNFPK